MSGIKSLSFFTDPFFYDQETKVFKHHLASMVQKGSSFGELGIMRLVPRAGSAICREDSFLGLLDSNTFRKILNNEHQIKIEKKMTFFKNNLLFDLNYNDQVKISYFFEKDELKLGRTLFKEGERLSKVVLIQEGEVEICKSMEIDIFEFSKEKKLNKIESEVLKKGVKERHGVNNDYKWTQRISIGGACMFLGGNEALKYLKNLKEIHRKPHQRKIFSDYTIKVSSENLKFYSCDIGSFQSILETFPQFRKNIESVLEMNNKKLLEKIEEIKHMKKKEIIKLKKISKMEMDMERAGLRNKIYTPLKGKKNSKFESFRGQLDNGVDIIRMVQMKEKILLLKQNKKKSIFDSENEKDLFSQSFLTSSSFKAKRKRKKSILNQQYIKSKKETKVNKRIQKYKEIKQELKSLREISRMNSKRNQYIIEVNNFDEMIQNKISQRNKFKSKESSKISFLRTQKRGMMLRKSRRNKEPNLNPGSKFEGEIQINSLQNSPIPTKRAAIRVRPKSLHDIDEKYCKNDFPGRSINNILITDVEHSKPMKPRSKTAKVKSNLQKLNIEGVFSFTKDTENSRRTKLPNPELNTKLQNNKFKKREPALINSLVLKSKKQRRLKSAFQRGRTQDNRTISKRSYSVEREFELPMVRNASRMARRKNKYGPDYYFQKVYEDRFNLTSSQLKKIRNGRNDGSRINKRNPPRYYI